MTDIGRTDLDPARRLRILMVSDFYQPFIGGVEVVVRNLAHELTARGHEVSVATIQGNGLAPLDQDGPVRIHRLRLSAARIDSLFSQRRTWAPPVPDPEAVVGLRRVLAAERPQIVHGHDWLARSLLLARRPAASGFIMSLHHYTVSCAKKNLFYRGAACTGPALMKCLGCGSAHYGPAKGPAVVAGNFVFAAAERRAVDLFVPVSEAAAAGNGLVGSDIAYEVIPNFVAQSLPGDGNARQLSKALPVDDFLLYVGDVSKDKGVEVLLEAYDGLTEAPPLVLIGKRWPDWSPELPANVHLFTEWPNAAVREAQRRCLALVSPSIRPEPFGMVVIETFAAGRPVIASNMGGMSELVEDGVNGLVVTPGDAVALRQAIAMLLQGDNLAGKLGEQAILSATRFRADAIVPRFERAYRRVLERRRGDSLEHGPGAA